MSRKHEVGAFAGKYMPPLNDVSLGTVKELSQLNLAGFSEEDVREEFLAPIVKLLGYGKGKDYDVRRGEDYKLPEAYLQVGRHRIELDYQFLIYKQGFWLLESKPAKEKEHEPTEEDIAQALFYAMLPVVDASFFAVSNGWWFLVFDRDSQTPTTPILKVRQTELPEQFDSIRRLLSADQITFTIKRRLLKRIEQVLSSDCFPGRTQQFINSVVTVGDKVSPLVQENFRSACFGQDDEIVQARGVALNNCTIEQLAMFPLGECWNRKEMQQFSEILLDKLSYSETDSVFYSKLCLDNARPVSVFYYFNCIYLAGRIADQYSGDLGYVPADCINTSNGYFTAGQLFEWFIRLCLSQFSQPHRPELKMIWLVEALAGRMSKRLLTYDPDRRRDIEIAVSLDQYFQPEKDVAQQNPHPAQKLVMSVEMAKRSIICHFFRDHFDAQSGQWNQMTAVQAYNQMLDDEKKLVDATPDYEGIKEKLGSSWSELMCTDFVNTEWYQLGAGVCDHAKDFPSLLKKLPSDLQDIFKKMAIAQVNYADECCKKMDIPFQKCPNEEISQLQKDFFNITL